MTITSNISKITVDTCIIILVISYLILVVSTELHY